MAQVCKALFSGFTLDEWRTGYQNGTLHPEKLLEVLEAAAGPRDSAWITLLDEQRLESQLGALAALP